MIRIQITATEVQTRSGTARATGNPYTIRTQEAYAYTVDPANGKPRPFPERISLQLEDNQQPYNVGDYTLSPACVYVGDYGRLNLGRPVLVALKAQAAA